MDALESLVIQAERFEHRSSKGGLQMQCKKSRSVASASDEPAIITPPEFSDVALASAFVARALSTFRWSPGLGWMAFNRPVWARDLCLQRYDIAKRICCEAANFADDDGEAKRIASAKTINALLSVAQADQRMVVPADVWDRDPMVLNTPGGIVDVATQEVWALGSEYVTQAARVTPDFSGACPVFHHFLHSVFLGDRDLIEFIRRSLGYMLTGDRREQVLWFWYGLGANGKSVLAELVQWIGGSYTLKLPAGVLMQARGERHPTELAQLRGKRLAVSSELDENSFFNESLIKELTGDNTLTAGSCAATSSSSP